MMPRSALYDIAAGMLQAVVAGWPAAPTPALPTRQGVSDADAVWDCEQVATVVERMFPDTGNVTQEQWTSEPAEQGLRACVIAVWVLRCVPDVDSEGQEIILPEASDVSASALDILGDAITVQNLIFAAQKAGNLATCSGIAFENWTPARSGGIGGGVSRFRVQLMPVDDGT